MPTRYKPEQYDEFQKEMHDAFPLMFSGKYGGFAVSPGWWHIIKSLCSNIQHHIDQRKRTREILLNSNIYNVTIKDEIPQVVVEQIKEKLGGLRFYYVGGDDYISGMVALAESWALHTCEECGLPGEQRGGYNGGGWPRTLCDDHEAAYQKRMKGNANDQ